MRKYFFIVLFCLAPTFAYALKPNVLIGLVVTSSYFEQEITTTGTTGKTEPSISGGAGLFLNLPMGLLTALDIGVQAVERKSKASGLTIDSNGSVSATKVEFKHQFLEFFLVPRLQPISTLSVGAGAYYATTSEAGLSNDLGLVGSARIILGMLGLEARYLHGINDVDNLANLKTKYRQVQGFVSLVF